jgi:hypothetical protein
VSSQRVDDYYEVIAQRCDHRADIYASRGLLEGMGKLGVAAARGVYGSRRTGRFRPAAFAKDATDVVLRAVRSDEGARS